jgi:RNA polymerase sporulation-specific sigma factor
MELKDQLPERQLNQLLEIAKDDIYARNMVVEHNLRLVMWVAKKYYQEGHTEMDDLFQWGVIGLMKAIDKYDPGRKGSFSTVAVWYIKSYMRNRFEFSTDVPLDKPLKIKGDSSGSIQDLIPSDDSAIEDVVESRRFIEQFKDFFQKKLDYVSYETIVHFYGLNDRGYKIVEIAELLKLPESVIKNAKDRGLNTLRRSVFFRDIMPKLDEDTIFIKAFDYSNPRTSSGVRVSTVERIVLEREARLKDLYSKFE